MYSAARKGNRVLSRIPTGRLDPSPLSQCALHPTQIKSNDDSFCYPLDNRSNRAASTSFGAHQDASAKEEGAPTISTVSTSEAKKFAKLSKDWWQPYGPMHPLHQLNPTRCEFIRDALCDHFGSRFNRIGAYPLKGLKLLDVGCGGGLLSEALARMGAEVHGIDVNDQLIEVARSHARLDPLLAQRLTYEMVPLEKVAHDTPGKYDVVIASEVIEHVESIDTFCKSLVNATKSSGGIVISTLARTLGAYLGGIVAAERILGWVPTGTHSWEKFINPEELVLVMKEAGVAPSEAIELDQIAGISYNLSNGSWQLSRDLGINYISYFRKG